MRVLLIGSPAARRRIRLDLNGSIDIVAEFDSLAAARASTIEADALLVADGFHRDEAAPAAEEPLTARETQVLELLAQGLSNKAIATRLGISDQTVKFHVAAICGKLGAANRTDAVRRGVRRGLIVI
jgi:DNA-binding NarL/FixJ family response regulator